MMTPKNKKQILFFSGLAVFAVILIAGTNFFLLKLGQEKAPSGGGLPGDPSRYEIKNTIDDDRPIIYTDAGFSPTSVTINARDKAGCMITLTNKSSRPLQVGLSPHNAAGDPGVQYTALPPDGYAIYDVRYPGLTEARLHNHANPLQEVTVIYGVGCR